MKKDIGGLTLIELIISIAIIGIIAIAFIPLFTMSAKANRKSETMLGSTYTGKDAMEYIYQISRETAYRDIGSKLIEKGYVETSQSNIWEKKIDDKRHLKIEFKEEGNLIRTIVRVYKGEQVESQYESLFTWKGRGILSDN